MSQDKPVLSRDELQEMFETLHKQLTYARTTVDDLEDAIEAALDRQGWISVPTELLFRVLDSEDMDAMANASDELRAMLAAAPQINEPPQVVSPAVGFKCNGPASGSPDGKDNAPHG
jgi:hypothetical protein